MARALRVAVVLSVLVVSLAIGAAKGGILFDGERDDEAATFGETVALTLLLAAWPLAIIWVVVLFVLLADRLNKRLHE